ncbi:MAG: hypothetical protein IJS08_15935 [Victivallales bacterium]|nr:hypothetical protein [Victivallales bacterium]
MRFYPLLPYVVILIAALLAFAAVYIATRKAASRPRILLILRLCSITIMLLMLLSPGLLWNRTSKANSNLVFLVDCSASMSANDMPGNASRFTVAQETLRKLYREPFQKSKKHLYFFNHGTIPAEGIAEADKLTPNGNTDLKQALESVDRDLGIGTASAIVILTDGLDHSQSKGIQGGTPVFAVKTGTDMESVPDLRIEAFNAPSSLRTGEELELNVPVALRQASGEQNIALKISVDEQMVQEENISLTQNERKVQSFKTSFAKPGLHKVLLELDRLPNEASYLNNSREMIFEVLEDELSPVLYFPVLTNTFRPLTRLFSQTGRTFTAIYTLRKGTFQILGTSADSTYDHGIPKNHDLMKGTALLFLGSGNAEDYTEAELKSIEAYVSDGGTVLIYGGPGAFGNTDSRLFTALLPVRSNQSRYTDATFKLLPTEDSLFHDLYKEQLSIRGLNMVDYVKSGAEVLLSVQGDRKYPLVVAMPYGRGRVVAVLSNSLHLLGAPDKRARLFRSFWETLLVHAGSNGTETLALSVPEHISEGMPLKVTATAEGITSAQATLTPEDTSGMPQTVKMLSNGNMHSCIFPDVPKGKYMLEVNCSRKNASNLKRYAMVYCGSGAAENDDLKVSDDNFMRFTIRGRIYLPEETNRLCKDINELLRKNEAGTDLQPVLFTPFLALALILLLMAEWLLRRKRNLF